MNPYRAHFVLFESPGTFVHETSDQPIPSWDTALAAEMARGIVERHAATPFAFTFVTRIVHDPIPDGEGGELTVLPRQVARSGRHFLGGNLRDLWSMEAEGAEGERILCSNMRGNGWPVVVEVTGRWRTTQPFDWNDGIVDPATGAIVRRGDEPELMAMRERLEAERKAKLEAFYAANPVLAIP